MKLNRLLTAGLILAGLMVYVACRKFDQQNEPNGLSLNEEKFFSKYPPSDPLLTSIRNYFKGKNEQFNFAEKVVERIGYPRWDKTYTVTGAASRIITEAEGDTVAVTYIPFVREEENFVNASLLVKTTPTDTAFKYVCDWQYASYGFDTTATGWNANDVFHVFALMDNLVFGRNSFRIVDSNLLVAAERNALQSANLSFNTTTVTRTLGSTGTGRG